MSASAEVPEGFERVQRIQPHTFAGLVGPFYAKHAGREVSVGLRIEERHLNNRGTSHGGLLATLADIALGYACAAAEGAGKNFVTIDLQIQYLASTRVGDWVQSEVKVLNAGTRTASAVGHLLANGEPVARISANFRMARTGPAAPPAPEGE
jgi:acyl-coenzyme A thioesterase 13